MLLETPEMEKAANGSKRSSQVLENFGDLESTGIVGNGEKNGSEQRLSAFLRNEAATGSGTNGARVSHSPSHSLTSNQSKTIRRPSAERPPRPSFISTPEVRTDSNSPGHTVSRADIRASAEKILYTFVLPGSEREIILPETILNKIIHAIEEEGRDDPEVFDDAKDYVFQAMERDAFPGFLQAKALGNLVPLSIIIRLSAGLASFGAAFWGGYYMILTDQPRHIRCWVS
jgi:Regulator of G protein signaling domain